MFVRFREYTLAKGGRSLRFEVVENYRDKCSGKVRQRSVAYLTSVKEQWLKYPRVRAVFWRQVEKKLSGLTLSDADTQKVRAAIERRIPRVVSLPPYRRSTKPLTVAPAPVQPPSSPAAEDPEQSAEELLLALASKLGLEL